MATKTRKTKTSKGERRSISNGVNLVIRDPITAAGNLVQCWRKGQNPWITVENVERNKPFISVRANVLWGDFRRRNTSAEDGQ